MSERAEYRSLLIFLLLFPSREKVKTNLYLRNKRYIEEMSFGFQNNL